MRSIRNMIRNDRRVVATLTDNQGGFGDVVAAYLFNSFLSRRPGQ